MANNATQPRIVYEVSRHDLSQAITDTLEQLTRERVLARFTDRLVSVNTVAEIHGVNRDTVIKYATAKLIPHQKDGKLYKFKLSEALEIDFNKLRQRI